jgi:hypothetical protein
MKSFLSKIFAFLILAICTVGFSVDLRANQDGENAQITFGSSCENVQ